jgi:drug/metabolite transporter (DMT)-like permease
VNARQATMLIALAAIWGASFLLIAIAVDDFGAAGVAEGRILLGVGGLLLYALALRSGLPGLRRVHATEGGGPSWRDYLLLGGVNAALPFVLIAAAEETIPASIAAIVNATAPLFAAFIAAVWLGEALNRYSGAGLALGLAGVALVVGLAPIDINGHTLLAVSASLGAAAAYAVGGHFTKRRFAGEPPLGIAIGQLGAAALWLVPAVAIVPPPHTPGAGPIGAVLGLGLVATGIAYLLYFRLIEEVGATSALTVTQLVPVFGVLWAALFRGERLTLGMLAGGVVVLLGVLLVTGTLPRRRSPQPPLPDPHAADHDPLPEPRSAAPQRATS